MSLLAYGLIALAILSSIGYGYKVVKDSGREEVRLEWAAANEAARRQEAERSAAAAAALEAERKKRRVVVKERTVYVDREIEKLVTSASCLSSDGVRTLNCAIDGTSAAGCKPAGAVPAPRPPG